VWLRSLLRQAGAGRNPLSYWRRPTVRTHAVRTCRAGSLYGELARFVLRLLGYKAPAKAAPAECAPGEAAPAPGGLPGGLPGAPVRGALPGAPAAPAPAAPRSVLPGAPAAGGGRARSWDGVWGKQE
jgi:hypothetical protein